jgi:hypothetical protein
MDRRAFFKSLLSTPAIAPLIFAAARGSESCELYLISESPERYLPGLLQELEKQEFFSSRAYFFSGFHPREKLLEQALLERGWRRGFQDFNDSLALSFRHLGRPTFPSFTLVKGGKILDLRSSGLSVLWEKICTRGSSSSEMSVVSYRPAFPASGDRTASLYINGTKSASLRLDRNGSFLAPVANGLLRISIQDGTASVTESSCGQKICLSSGPIGRPGERIICAPNRFLLEITGRRFPDAVIG